jgi:uncharacterized membrane protein
MRRPGLVLAGAALAAFPFAFHALILSDRAGAVAATVGWVLAVGTALACVRAGAAAGVELAAVLGAIGLAWYASAGGPYAVFVPPLAVNLLLLWFFGRTLAPGREPLVTAIARLVRGRLDPEIERYTRHVTWAWCGFFAANAAVSAALAALAPLAAWSLYTNVLATPLFALMFAAEYAYRRRRFPALEHVPPFRLLERLLKAGYFGSTPRTK